MNISKKPDNSFSIDGLTKMELLAVRDALEKQHFAGQLKQEGKNVLNEMNSSVATLIRS
jgi:hypothetical protein